MNTHNSQYRQLSRRQVGLTALMVLGLALLFAFLFLVRAVAVPFLLALVLAYFLDPAVDFLERHKIPRSLSILLVFLSFLLVAGGLLAFLIPAVAAEIEVIRKALPEYARNLYRVLPDFLLERIGLTGDADLQTILSRFFDGARSLSFDMVNQTLGVLSRAFKSTLSIIVALLGYFIIPVYLFYLLRDYDRIREKLENLIPHSWRSTVFTVVGEMNQAAGGFIRGQFIVCLILALLYAVGLLTIGLDLALMLSLIAGLGNLIPYLGTIIGGGAAVLVALGQYQDFLHPFLVIAWFSVVQMLEGTIITPRIVGDKVGLHPLATILAVLSGGQLFGFIGLLLAVPVTAALKVAVVHLLQWYRHTGFYAHGEKEGEHGTDH